MRSSIKHVLEMKYMDCFIGILIIFYPFLFIWQGGDLTDTGFHAIHCQNFFKDMTAGVIPSKTVLTYFIGGCWLEVFPRAGVLGLRILYVLFFQGILLFVYLTLKELKQRRVLLTGLLCGEVFALRFTGIIFNYDIVSAFFLMLTVVCIWRGFNKNPFWWLFAAGVSAGLAFLVRFPNILIALLIPAVFVYYSWIKFRGHSFKEKISLAVKQYVYFLSGFILVVLCFFMVLRINGLLGFYVSDLVSVKETLMDGSGKSGHSLLNILYRYAQDVRSFLPYVLVVFFTGVAISCFDRFSKSRALTYAVGGLCVLWAMSHFYGSFSYGNSIRYFVPALCVIPVFFALILKLNSDARLCSLVLMACMIAFIGVAGSNTGLFLKLSYGLLLLIPLLGLLLWNCRSTEVAGMHVQWRALLSVSAVIILSMSVIIRTGWIYHVSSGLRSRLKATHSVDHKLMRGIYTTRERAEYVNDVLHSINLFIRDDNTLFIYGHEPLFYYLTEHRPPVRTFWMANNVTEPRVLFKKLRDGIFRTGSFPLVVITKKDVLGEKGLSLLCDFLEENNYECLEKTGKYEIWNISGRRSF